MACLLCVVPSLILVLLLLIVYKFKKVFKHWEEKNFPSYGKPTIPFGNLQNPLKATVAFGDQVSIWYHDMHKKGHKHFGAYFSNKPAYVPVDAEMVKRVLQTDFSYFSTRGLFYNEKYDPLSAHLFAIEGNKWKNLRAKLSATFTSGRMKTMFHTIVISGENLEKAIEKNYINKEPLEIKELLQNFTLDIIASCAFGLDAKSFDKTESAFKHFGTKFFEVRPIRRFLITFGFAAPRLAKALGVRVIEKDVSDFFMGVIKDTVEYRKRNNVQRDDFLQLLMGLNEDNENAEVVGDGKSLTFEELAAQSFIFIAAGYETSSTTTMFALFELALNQEFQEKVREEINEVLERHDGKLTYEAIMEMKYMQQVVDETLRKYPPVSLLTRTCVKDYKLPDSDVIISKGSRIPISVLGIHYNEDYWPNPTKFDPDRFSVENRKHIHQFSHIPFGEGPRMCIGLRFGLLQTKVGLAVMLRKYRFSLNSKTTLPLKYNPKTLTLTVVGGVWLDFEKV